MSIPITINFFREIELYQELKTLDKKFKKDKAAGWKVWNTEKAILSWCADDTSLANKRTSQKIRRAVLKEGSLSLAEIIKEHDIHLTVPMENLIKRGFAEGNREEIILTKEGVLMGTVINKSKKISGKIHYELFYWLTWAAIISGSFIVILNALEKLSRLIPWT